MIRMNNDYCYSAHPEVLKALNNDKANSYPGYSTDEVCKRAEKLILEQVKNKDAKVYFLIGGTPTNATVIHSILSSYQGVISADTGHINTNETGAVENIGHKIIPVPNVNGKVTAEQIEKLLAVHNKRFNREHVVEPKLVYISQPTEIGTLYSKKELTEIREVCNKYNLYLFADGARLSYGLGSKENDVSLSDMGKLCDAFYIGGTKCGTLFGEAVVMCNPLFQDTFRCYMKQNGSMLAKGWLLGLQFEVLFKDNLYFNIGEKATSLAMRIKEAIKDKGLPIPYNSPTNQQFVILNLEQTKKVSEKFFFEPEEVYEDGSTLARFCTSWATKEEDVETLINCIKEL